MTALSTYFSTMIKEKGVEFVDLVMDNSTHHHGGEFNRSTSSSMLDSTSESSPLKNTETKRDRWNRMKQKAISDCTLNKPRRRISDNILPQEEGSEDRTRDTSLSMPRRRISDEGMKGDILLNQMLSNKHQESKRIVVVEERIDGSSSNNKIIGRGHNAKWDVIEMQKGQTVRLPTNKFDHLVIERNSPFPPAS